MYLNMLTIYTSILSIHVLSMSKEGIMFLRILMKGTGALLLRRVQLVLATDPASALRCTRQALQSMGGLMVHIG